MHYKRQRIIRNENKFLVIVLQLIYLRNTTLRIALLGAGPVAQTGQARQDVLHAYRR